MIQLLFVAVFFTTVAPVLLALCLRPTQAEQRLIAFGLAGRVVAVSFLTCVAIVQMGWFLETAPFNFFELLNRSVFYYLVMVPIHELGHFVFLPLGHFMHVLGGSLLEVGMPAGLFVYFLWRKCPRVAAFMLFFVGHHVVHVAQYMSTSRTREQMTALSLDQNPDLHDWYQIFSALGVLEQDTSIAFLTKYVGLVIMILALLFLMIVTEDSEEILAEDLNPVAA